LAVVSRIVASHDFFKDRDSQRQERCRKNSAQQRLRLFWGSLNFGLCSCVTGRYLWHEQFLEGQHCQKFNATAYQWEFSGSELEQGRSPVEP
jgi:hypothetical protein